MARLSIRTPALLGSALLSPTQATFFAEQVSDAGQVVDQVTPEIRQGGAEHRD